MNDEIETILHREDITLAPIRKRSLAFFIDEILLSFLLIFALWDSFTSAQTMEEVISLTNSFVLEYMAIKIIYQAFFIMQYGASLGKLAMKIRVIEVKTLQNPNVLSSLNRAIFRVISEMFFYLGFLWGMMDPSRQTWHDKTAKTLVVNA
ncbi:RDD family protein [Sulfurimonas aquatica]|uniref:RDD family protein n=1 Tax=Sulfurimonas aquatica TaxID=2672570 RepID=A0A975GBX9_9BACT|nr:RDD family protein [Sulfurimonas aquatica]QSZ41045.1 RDD family protein [Sulfurimonas aquatica]